VSMSRRGLIYTTVVLMLATIAVAVDSPAFAAGVGVSVTSRFTRFEPGDTQRLTLTVSNGGAPSVTVSVSGLSDFTAGDPRGCADGGGSTCTVTFGPGETSKSVSFSIAATGSVPAGQSKTDRGTVTARQNVLLGGADSAGFEVTLAGPQPTPAPAAASVASVSGVVTDATTGGALGDAVVVLADSGACAPGGGRQPCQALADGNGQFTFTTSPSRPLAPGQISVSASRNGYRQARVALSARAGQSVRVALRLQPAVAASSSVPSDSSPAADGLPPATDPTAAPVARAAVAARRSGVLSPVLIFGGLLVLLGVGALAMMLRRRGSDDTGFDWPAAITPPATSRYDSADQPTVVHPPVAGDVAEHTAVAQPWDPEDEFPDPYPARDPAGPASGGETEGAYRAAAEYWVGLRGSEGRDYRE
jgi:hypothetical protein